jgi:hypothetical protein
MNSAGLYRHRTVGQFESTGIKLAHNGRHERIDRLPRWTSELNQSDLVQDDNRENGFTGIVFLPEWRSLPQRHLPSVPLFRISVEFG